MNLSSVSDGGAGQKKSLPRELEPAREAVLPPEFEPHLGGSGRAPSFLSKYRPGDGCLRGHGPRGLGASQLVRSRLTPPAKPTFVIQTPPQIAKLALPNRRDINHPIDLPNLEPHRGHFLHAVANTALELGAPTVRIGLRREGGLSIFSVDAGNRAA